MKKPFTDELPADGPVTWEDVLALQQELKRTARELLRDEGNAGTVHTTQLVNSALKKLRRLKKLNPDGRDWREVSWANRRFFFADANQAMRFLLIDYARARQRRKEDKVGGFESELIAPKLQAGILNLDRLVDQAGARAELAEAIDRALDQLDRDHPGDDLAEIVQCRSFDDLNQSETAAMLGISVKTVWKREKLAYGLLRQALAEFFPRLTSPSSAGAKSKKPRRPAARRTKPAQ